MNTEEAAIKKAIMDYYHQGHVESNPELYNEILHDDWKFFYFEPDGRLNIVNKQEYMSWYNPQEADKSLNWETEFYYVDITENFAQVKMRLECQKVKYLDYFQMVKLDGKWWIVHKMCQPVRSDK